MIPMLQIIIFAISRIRRIIRSIYFSVQSCLRELVQKRRFPAVGSDCYTQVEHHYVIAHRIIQDALQKDEQKLPSAVLYHLGLTEFEKALAVFIPGNGLNQTRAVELKERIKRSVRQIKERIEDLESPPIRNHTPTKSGRATFKGAANALISARKVNNITRPNKTNASSGAKQRDINIPGTDPKMVERILSELLSKNSNLKMSDVIGNKSAKQALRDMILLPTLRPDLFTGLLTPPKGLLLYGPPGNGKTLLVKALSNDMTGTNFFNISASTLTSKWVGDGEKMVKTLFAVACYIQPTVIFIDEIDSILTTRSDSDSDSLRRLKTEFLIQFDGAATSVEDRVTVIGATNLPNKLDEAVLRRFPKRILIDLPNSADRLNLLKLLLKKQKHQISERELASISEELRNYSSSDVTQLAKDAALEPLRELNSEQVQRVACLRGMKIKDLRASMKRIRPSTTEKTVAELLEWTHQYGEG